jgi:hypothetical protein
MKSVLIVMTLLGCDCDGIQCQHLHTVSSGWRNVEACQADIEKQIAAQKASYPLLEAKCVASSDEQAPALASHVDRPAVSKANIATGGQTETDGGGRRQDMTRIPEPAFTPAVARTAGLFSQRNFIVGFVRDSRLGDLVRLAAHKFRPGR